MRSRSTKPVAVLPGHELVAAGIAGSRSGLESEEALLVSIGAPRLARLGFEMTSPIERPEHRLYATLSRQEPNDAHSRYNALVRRLVSFES